VDEKATRRRGAALEAAILDAAWDLLETDGWNGFTFGGIAERAHSSKPVLYRRWRTREDLLRATVRRRGEISQRQVPDTGSLRGDTIALLTGVSMGNTSMAAVMSLRLSTHYDELSLSMAELRQELLGDRQPVMDVIVARAAARGELGPKDLPARVVSVPFDLLRNEFVMTLEPITADAVTSIVDDVFLPLARLWSGLPDGLPDGRPDPVADPDPGED
jgi:AcrR family transcriptional regulator